MDVDSGVRIVRTHAIMNDVIGIRVVERHASIHVVIGIRTVLCHPLVHNFGFPLRVQILILLSCFSNSSLLWPEVILHTFCTEEIRHLRCGIYTPPSVTVDPSAVNDPSVTK